MNIYVDIDETICISNGDYENAKPMYDRIAKINKLYDEGNTITYWTARGSVTQKNWFEVTFKQLEDWGCKYNEIRMGKPAYDLFIDDKVINSQEFFKDAL
jgi:hypothetical protein